jgi:hypothetical protein
MGGLACPTSEADGARLLSIPTRILVQHRKAELTEGAPQPQEALPSGGAAPL